MDRDPRTHPQPRRRIMARWISLMAIGALSLFALPAAAQQDTTGGAVSRQERTTEDAGQGTAQDTSGRQTTAVPGAEKMGADSAMLGRQGEGISRPGAGAGGNAAAPREDYGKQGQTGQAGETGGEMPTTASPLPLVLMLGTVLTLLGLAMRVLARR
jgi:hypothetical protein